jgi:hypothetical protein
MTRQAQKELERRQLALAMRVSPNLLPADVDVQGGREKDEPDLVVQLASGWRVGIEVTALRDRQEVDGYTPSQLEAARVQIVRCARALYLAAGGRPVCVNAGIGAGPYDIELAARCLAAMVSDHAADGVCVSAWPKKDAPLEMHVSVWPCLEEEDEWRFCAVGETKLLTQEFLLDVISGKQKKLSANPYKTEFDEIWLLIVAAAFPSSSDFVFPRNTADWLISHPSFDRVLVLSQSDEKVLTF